MGRRFNQSYHTRAERRILKSRAAIDLLRPAHNPPARPLVPAKLPAPDPQLKLFEEYKPLADLFPEAYL